MKYGSIPGIARPVSRVVMGTLMVHTQDIHRSFALLDAALAHGLNTFDTAHDYSQGDNERAVGQWINDRGVREQIVLIGKGANANADRKRVTPFDITADLYDSLARFNTDYIDLYLLHRDDPAVPVGPIIDVLNEHLAAGRIRAFGGSNWSHRRIEEANAYAQEHGLTPFVASSPHFSLAEQLVEPWPGCLTIGGPRNVDARRWYRNTRMALLTWSSLAGGFLSGRFRRDNLDTFDGYFDQISVRTYASEENFRRLDRAAELAGEKGLSLPQIALAYVLSQPLNIFALVAPANEDEVRTTVAASDLKLSPAELAWLDLTHERQ